MGGNSIHNCAAKEKRNKKAKNRAAHKESISSPAQGSLLFFLHYLPYILWSDPWDRPAGLCAGGQELFFVFLLYLPPALSYAQEFPIHQEKAVEKYKKNREFLGCCSRLQALRADPQFSFIFPIILGSARRKERSC